MHPISASSVVRGFLLPFLAATGLASSAHAIPISSVPITISTPGTYEVTQDLIYGGGSGTGTAIMVQANNVTINFNGRQLRSVVSSPATGIYVNQVSGVTIQGGQISDFPNGGIFLSRSSRSNVNSNTVVRSRYGIQLSSCQACSVTNNTAQSCSVAGIATDNSQGITVTSNRTTDCVVGIYALGGQGCVFRGNQCSNGVFGVVVDYGGGHLFEANSATNNSNTDMLGRGTCGCEHSWRNNLFVTDNESGPAMGPLAGCIR